MVPGVISRIKIMSELDISEKRLPQDGRVGLTVDGRHVDIRVVTLPVQRGEAAIMRILDSDAGALELDNIGMLDHERKRVDHALKKTYGTILATGPTGSGKSTTLYGALGTLNTPGRSIITVEDPVEFELDGVKQIQVNNKTGLNFAKGLRSMMRADPDIIMVGEIRDKETAKIAIEAALTGHLVLSTLHTNDAPTAVARLIEMGVEPFLVASAIDTVVAQRLARRLCDSCRKQLTVTAEQMRDHGFKIDEDMTVWEPSGCTRCSGTGYKGRIGLFEVMVMSDHLRSMALSRESSEAIAEVAVREGMRRLRDDGFEKIKLGWTSVAEVVRVTGS
jgi:type IV pilus assembly protein PilB